MIYKISPLRTMWAGSISITNWWTHKLGGLHKNDFIRAAKTDVLANP
jgi:4a-hydroxytetrahydrobiopterin dehydratase